MDELKDLKEQFHEMGRLLDDEVPDEIEKVKHQQESQGLYMESLSLINYVERLITTGILSEVNTQNEQKSR